MRRCGVGWLPEGCEVSAVHADLPTGHRAIGENQVPLSCEHGNQVREGCRGTLQDEGQQELWPAPEAFELFLAARGQAQDRFGIGWLWCRLGQEVVVQQDAQCVRDGAIRKVCMRGDLATCQRMFRVGDDCQ